MKALCAITREQDGFKLVRKTENSQEWLTAVERIVLTRCGVTGRVGSSEVCEEKRVDESEGETQADSQEEAQEDKKVRNDAVKATEQEDG